MSTKKTALDKTGYPFERSPLDPVLLTLQPDELSFFKAQTGIADNEKLREHILHVQAEAYDKFPYPCIRRFTFTNLKIARFPEYEHVLRLGQCREGAIFLDVGCCFGNDIRTVIADGYPRQNIVALDLRRGFWDLGHKLFNSTPRSFPVTFIEGDIFDPAILPPSPPRYTPGTPITKAPSLLHLNNSLTALQHHVSVIHASAFFHLFSSDQQLQIAHKLATLLSPLPGSIILGSHIGQATSGIKTNTLSGSREMFCHSPESWRAMWDGVVFEEGAVEVHAVLSDVLDTPMTAKERALVKQGPDNPERWRTTQWLSWSVKRR